MDSLYGMKTFFRVSACSDRAEMTFPRVSKDLLMLAPSWNSSDLNNILFLNKFKIKKRKKCVIVDDCTEDTTKWFIDFYWFKQLIFQVIA